MMSEDPPRRFFPRRVAALIVDGLLFYAVVWALGLLLQPIIPIRVLIPSPFGGYVCQAAELNKNTSQAVTWLAPQYGETISLGDCTSSLFGLDERRMITVAAIRRDGNMRFTRSISYLSNSEQEPIPYIDLQVPMLILMPGIFAFILAKMGSTPGKALFKLAVRNRDNSRANMRQYFIREYLKNLPVIILAGLTLAVTPIVLFPVDYPRLAERVQGGAATPLLILSGVIAVIGIAVFLVSFFRWRGAMFYDHFAGVEVVKSRH